MTTIEELKFDVSSLEEALRPYERLKDVWWERLVNVGKKDGWLACSTQLYFSMKATSPLLLFAANQASSIPNLRSHFVPWALHHAEEEQEHHKWFLDDLEAIGINRKQLVNSLPDEHMLNLIGIQFALVAVVHPVSTLGYYFAMERPVDENAAKSLAKKLMIHEDGFRTILYHANADKGHHAEIVKLVSRYAKDPLLFNVMLTSGVQAFLCWANLIRKILENYS